MRILTVVFIVLVSVVISACNGAIGRVLLKHIDMTNEIANDYLLEDRKDVGVLVFSLTVRGSDNVLLLMRGVTNSYTGAAFLSRKIQVPPPPDSVDWLDPLGRLIAVELPVGKYDFYSWMDKRGSVASTSGASSMNIGVENFSPKEEDKFSVKFEVLPGTVNYIGNIHFDFDKQKKTWRYSRTDLRDRDLVFAYKRHPLLKKSPLAIDLDGEQKRPVAVVSSRGNR